MFRVHWWRKDWSRRPDLNRRGAYPAAPTTRPVRASLLQRCCRERVWSHRREPRLGVKRSTIYALCAKGVLSCVRVGSLLRMDLDGFLTGRYAGPSEARAVELQVMRYGSDPNVQ